MQANDSVFGFSFIDMSYRQPMTGTTNNAPKSVNNDSSVDDVEALSKLKRTACVLCRKRKLKCDGGRPKCQTCNRLGHECKYDEVRKKSGPKRGYVKALEARLAQVETQLKSSAHDAPDTGEHANEMDTSTNGSSDSATSYARKGSVAAPEAQSFPFSTDTSYGTNVNCGIQQPPMFEPMADTVPMFDQNDLTASLNAMSQFQDSSLSYEEPVSWDMISLGLEEPLPTNEVAEDLNELFFNKVYPSVPILNRARFYSNMHLAPNARPPVCIRYAMWTLAAGLEDRYSTMAQHFYRRARKYLQLDEMKGFGEGILSLYHCQAWVLISTHEFKNMHFPRAWMSTGRASRLAQMLGLHRLDGQGLDVKQCLQPAKDWIEKEERRRTFWMAFSGDRCSSIGTGWPMTIDEQDILTRLPASEESFQNGVQEPTLTLNEAMDGRSSTTSGFALCTLLSALFGRNLIHLHRPSADDREHDLGGRFWERHRKLDAILVNINLSLPHDQRIPFGLPDPNVIFLNMCIHTSVICLHQAAIFKADKYRMAPNVSAESKVRCLTAAGEIANIMRAITHLELATMNPFMVFCLYVGARVFVQYLKARRNDQQILASLDFLLRAMHVMKRKNGLTESFIAQLDLDMETAGIPNPNFQGTLDEMIKKGVPVFPRSGKGAQADMLTLTRPDTLEELSKMNKPQQQGTFQPTTNMNMPRPPAPFNGVHDPRAQHRFQSVSTSASPDPQEMNLPFMNQRQARPPSRKPNTWDEALRPTSNGRLEATYPPSLNDGPSPHTMSETSTEPLHRSPTTNFDMDSVPRQNSYPSVPNTWSNLPGLTSAPSPASNHYNSKPNSHSNTTSATTPSSINPHGTTPPVTIESDFNTMTNQLFPQTPGVDLSKVPEGWDWPAGTGMTPGGVGAEDWEKILGDMSGWDPSANHLRSLEPWNLGRGPYG